MPSALAAPAAPQKNVPTDIEPRDFEEPSPKTRRFALLARRSCLVPTWRGWLLLLVIWGVAACLFVKNIYGFLAMTAPVPRGALVVEGWATDVTLSKAVREFNNGTYEVIFSVGAPIERGTSLSEYKSYADLGRAVLISQGVPENKVISVPTPGVKQDRTYFSFKMLRLYMETNHFPEAIHLYSEGPHARRSWLMLRQAMKGKCELGVTAVDPEAFDPDRWWGNSSGVKAVMGEVLSYFYTRVLFRAPEDETP